jgi:hypothetical protein
MGRNAKHGEDEALGLTHDSIAGVPGGVAFMLAPTGEGLELLAVKPTFSAKLARHPADRP